MCDCLTLSGLLITVMCLQVHVSFTHSPMPTSVLTFQHVYTHTQSRRFHFYRVCFHVRLGRLCLINFKRQHCVLARAGVCLFMGLCARLVFVGPKCVLNLDRGTSMCTVIIFLLHVSHRADGGCLELWAFTEILLVYSMINMALKTSVWLTLNPVGIMCERILMLVMILNLTA